MMTRFPVRGGPVVPSLLRLAALCGALGALTAAEPTVSDDAAPIVIAAPVGDEYHHTRVPLRAGDAPVAADGAAALRGVPGVALARLGGHGCDPVVRGQQRGRLQVLLDGAAVTGGCPNRMDPTSAYASSGRFDAVHLRHGVTTLVGPLPTPAGRVDFVRATPAVGVHGNAALGAVGNGAGRQAAGEWSARTADDVLRIAGDWETARDYQDGDGRAVRSGYRTRGGNLALGRRSDRLRLDLTAAYVAIDDALFAGAGMDSPESEMQRVAVAGDWRSGSDGILRAASWRLAHGAVDHVMDNFSLRPLAAPMAMRAPSSTDSTTGHADLTVALLDGALRWGIAGQRIDQDATRLAGMDPSAVTAVQSRLWPDVRREEIGVYAEYDRPVGERLDLRLGLRIDRHEAEARAAHRDPPPLGMQDPPAPADLYRSYYGADADAVAETLVAALLRLDADLGVPGLGAHLALSRVLRPADASERFLAAWSPMPGKRWIGNPDLDHERHRQLAAGVTYASGPWRGAVRGFRDDVADWIMRDTAQGQDGVRLADGASIYRNVDATLWGGEADWSWRGEHLRCSLGLGYVRGANDSDATPLPQMPPLQGRVTVTWHGGDWSMGALCDIAGRQDRVDPESGLDLGPTPGYAVVGLRAESRLDHGLSLRLGVDNLFDKAYAGHLNRASAFDPDVTRVNEPGLRAWATALWEF